jgi:hypothetical protein
MANHLAIGAEAPQQRRLPSARLAPEQYEDAAVRAQRCGQRHAQRRQVGRAFEQFSTRHGLTCAFETHRFTLTGRRAQVHSPVSDVTGRAQHG